MEVFIKNIFHKPNSFLQKKIIINGWIRNCRYQKNLVFIELNDGTFLENLQIVCKKEVLELNDALQINFEKLKEILQIGASLKIEGFLKESKNNQNFFEVLAQNIILLGSSDFSYPIQPKKHSNSFLRKVAHLRVRTKLFGAVFRIRSTAFLALHRFFDKKGFLHVNTPIITINDGEGAGELFQLTSFNSENLLKDEKSKVDYHQDFFDKKVFLTVTGQLEAEAMALALNKVYTFGPTFRAEKSNTPRHAAEFWMLEPEMAFYDLPQTLTIVQEMIKEVITECLLKSKEDIVFLDQNVRQGLVAELTNIAQEKKFLVVKYQEAIEILQKSDINFENKISYGVDLATEHEKYLTEKYFKKPVFIIDWPKEIKAFYMKNNPDQKTVAAMDLLMPRVGELVGGSQREENLLILISKMEQMKVSQKDLQWYLDLRRFGSCIHSGFGLGFERFLLLLTGLDNIRDVIAFPRTYNNLVF
ncbi:asparagine--tRNA ligase ['Fragaria x ananassa' phyllody phytoplasma]|uniref:Asparagine--tRNA ligase n=1 Tax='Fragaria x ananassa' phyllody phytoplasma TaxID=2358428 RepID=A0ABS5K2Z1_9MOLU|nr:asparagine--tRNA ligase ['Fragaria x ananassa' phyllody phytoplasma]MBS2126263.1 asparagine--tRNA ligase ['Fragaria x ananassa' phyllody phytoplasma]